MVLQVKTVAGPVLYDQPPNGGWGWIVMVASACMYGIGYGISKSLGVFFLDIKQEFDLNNSETSWVSSLFFCSLGMAGIFVLVDVG